jgi:hypothetical protein
VVGEDGVLVTDLDRADVPVRDVAELLADATGAWSLELADRAASRGRRWSPTVGAASSVAR